MGSSGLTIKVPFLLVAMPQLEDPNFHQSVVMVLNHDQNGSFGIVINRRLDQTIGEVEIKERVLPKEVGEMPLWYGGPVEEEKILFLVSGPTQPLSSVQVTGSVYLGATLEFIAEKSILRDPQWKFRAYAGYAGWGGGQLAQELAVSSWLIAPFDPSFIFEIPPEKVWERAVHAIGLDPAQLATETSWTLQ